jgi:hypothetical protein
MREMWLAVAASVALLGLVSCLQRAEAPATSELGPRIAGTWLGTYEVDSPDSFRAAFITTYHPDGTAVTTSARAMGGGDPARYGLSTTHHIQWEATGPCEIRWRLLHFGHDVEGNLTYISRTHGVLEFDEAFEEGNGSIQVEVHAPDALLDPLAPNNPEAEPIFTARGRNTIRRLHTRIPAQDEP